MITEDMVAMDMDIPVMVLMVEDMVDMVVTVVTAGMAVDTVDMGDTLVIMERNNFFMYLFSAENASNKSG